MTNKTNEVVKQFLIETFFATGEFDIEILAGWINLSEEEQKADIASWVAIKKQSLLNDKANLEPKMQQQAALIDNQIITLDKIVGEAI